MKSYFMLVSDQEDTINEFEDIQYENHEMLIARSEEEALELLIQNENYLDIVFIENIIFNRHGIHILKKLRATSYFPEYLLITEARNLDTITSCMISGASDCITKPLNRRKVVHKIDLAMQTNTLDRRVMVEVDQLNIILDEEQIDNIVYQDLLMKRVFMGNPLPMELSTDYFSQLKDKDKHLSKSVKTAIIGDIKKELNSYKGNILVIDDHVDAQDSLSLFLEANDHNVFIANSSDEGLKLAKQIEDLDVVFLDIDIQTGLPGIELLSLLVTEIPGCKVIILTSSDDIELAISSIKQGAFDYVNKPYSFEEIVAKLSRVFTMKIYPRLLKKSLQKLKKKTLCIDRRKAMLENFCETKKNKGEHITLEEIYVFFRECKHKKSSVSRDVMLNPDMILKEGVNEFVDHLLHRPLLDHFSN